MPHPYTQPELDAMVHPYHVGTCAHCYPVDVANPTEAELLTRFECEHCNGGGMFFALWHDEGIAQTCDGCGGETIEAFLGRSVDVLIRAPRPGSRDILCLNCRIQEHAGHCRAVDGDGNLIACPHGWAAGA